MRILALETSCDETAIAIADFQGGKMKPSASVLSHIVSSQVKLHAKFGGVVPNLAKREHQKNLVPLLLEALQASEEDLRFKNYDLRNIHESKIINLKSILEREPELLKQFNKHILPLKPPSVGAIAVTYGPGLEPALWVGVNFARALALLWEKPLIPVNHMAGHIYSALLEAKQRNPKHEIRSTKQIQNSNLQNSKRFEFGISNFEFPAIALLVSGGHTQLVLMAGDGKYKLLGETRDDAAGEAFDKVARLLGLGYPGGPEISRLAEFTPVSSLRGGARSAPTKQSQGKRNGHGIATPPSFSSRKVVARNDGVVLPRPMLHTKDYDFSFSGLKTAVFYLVRDLPEGSLRKLRPSLAKEFQGAVVEVLVKKTIRAAKEYKVKTILLGGGVAANKKLRRDLGTAIKNEIRNTKYQIPDTAMTGDNALMIALAAFFTGKEADWRKVRADANARL